MEPLNLKECALCHNNSALELSHIIPKFVVRYLKNTSVGKLRSADNPNATIQDGEKHYLLCGECEDRFSECEKKFADNIFHPYFKQHQRSFTYDKWLHYFITSVSWRHLYLDLLRFLYKGIIIKHNKTEPTYTKTSLFLCEKRRFFMARTEKGVVTTI